MYPITNEVKALFEDEQRKVLRITGKPMKKEDVSVGPSDIVTVNDAAAIPAKDITVGIEPVQDLHGYDHPWPAGGGKNKFDESIAETSAFYNEDGTFTNIITDTRPSAAIQIQAFNESTLVAAANARGDYPNRTIGTITINSSVTLLRIKHNGLSRDLRIQIPWTAQGTFTISCLVPSTDPTTVGGLVIKDIQVEEGSTATDYAPYSNICPISGWTGANVVVSPTTDAQDGTTYPISWQSEAGTVYGGTLDVTTGLLTVTWAEVDLGTLTWRYDTSNDFFKYNLTPEKADGTLLCSAYQYGGYKSDRQMATANTGIYNLGTNTYIKVKDTNYTDAAAFQSAMSGVQLCYELATPHTYQLSPTEVTLLLGDNNVWADTGNTTLTYRPYADLIITDDNVIADSFQVDRYSCNGEKLEVGTAIAAQLSFTLENGSGLYNSIVFEGAELFAEVGIADWTQSSPTITYVPCGYFTPDDQPRRLSTISITALDRMTKFDVVVDASALTFPTTVAGLVGQVCTLCGVTLAQSISGLINAGVSVAEIPAALVDITYRNIIQWCAGVMGTNAWFDWNGQLRFSWYANATGYVSTTDNRYNSDMYEDDLTISGVEYTNDSGVVILEGTDDYAIDLTGNAIAGPLIATVLPPLNTSLNGFTYRPFTAAAINAPYLWPMDVVTFTDKDGNNHTSALTNVAFGLNGTTAMESKGMTYAINKLAQPKGFTREQAQLVNQAIEHVEQDIDDSLTQQEIFNRLTDNGAAQGIILYNGQLYMNATYINAGYLNVGRINFNEPDSYYDVPDENDPDSLLSGQTVVDGWIVNTSGTGRITVFYCGFAIPLRGKTITVTFTYNGSLSGGADSWTSISSTAQQFANEQVWNVPSGQTIPNPYTHTVTVPDDAMFFSISVGCSGVKLIGVSLSSPVTPSESIEYSYEGQRIGGSTPFRVYRDGTLITYAKSIFNGVARMSRLYLNVALDVGNGGTGATTAARARANLEITPANIGAAVNSELTNQDLNDVTTPGFYNAGGGNTITNKPSGVDSFGMVVVHSASGAYYTQTVYTSGGTVWRRINSNGTWSNWQEEIGRVELVTDFDDFIPDNAVNVHWKYLRTYSGNASNAPISGDNIIFYGWVMGAPSYCMQCVYVVYADTAANRGRQFVRCRVNDTWQNWLEIYGANSSIPAANLPVANNLTTTVAGSVLDARMGNALRNREFVYVGYQGGATTTTYTITLNSQQSLSTTGAALLLVLKHYGANNTLVFDLVAVANYDGNIAAHTIVKNSTASIQSVSISGSTLTLTFDRAIYLGISVMTLT